MFRCLLSFLGIATALLCSAPTARSEVAPPLLKWERGGAYASFADTGWYSSPAVLDPFGTGTLVIGSAYSIFCLRGETGALIWRARSGSEAGAGGTDVGRTWPSVALSDMNRDGLPEIITAHGGGALSVYNLSGRFLPGWPWRVPGNNELRSLVIANLDAAGSPEIIVGRAAGSGQNTWVLNADAQVQPGWPQRTAPTPGYSYGVYDNNIAVANLSGDANLEIIVPSDVHYISAYDRAGASLSCNALYGPSRTVWAQVGVFFDFIPELRGYAETDLEMIRPNFATSPAAIADLDGDGTREIVVIGNNYDFSSGSYVSLSQGPYIFNADRTRYNRGGNDWRNAPAHGGAPLSEDYNVIENVSPAPALADLDGDGNQEIIYPSYDGKLHAVWLDKTEHGHWPYAVTPTGASVIRFASEPVIADLDRDGKMEVLCGTWPDKASGQRGEFLILSWDGRLLQQVSLPAAFGGQGWNGVLAAPTLANLDNDPDLEIVLNTVHSGLVAFDLPNTANARIAWGTGRGSFTRTGQAPSLANTQAKHWLLWE